MWLNKVRRFRRPFWGGRILSVTMPWYNKNMKISKKEQELLARVVRGVPGTEGVKAIIFGSQVRGEAHFGSDIDLGLESKDGGVLPPGLVSDVQEALDESPLLQRVDVVDLSRAGVRLRQEALAHAITI